MRIARRHGIVFREHFGGAHAPLLEDGGDSGHADVEQADKILAHDLHVSARGIGRARKKNGEVSVAVVFDHENVSLDSRIDCEQAGLDHTFAARIGESAYDGPHRRVTRDAEKNRPFDQPPVACPRRELNARPNANEIPTTIRIEKRIGKCAASDCPPTSLFMSDSAPA